MCLKVGTENLTSRYYIRLENDGGSNSFTDYVPAEQIRLNIRTDERELPLQPFF